MLKSLVISVILEQIETFLQMYVYSSLSSWQHGQIWYEADC